MQNRGSIYAGVMLILLGGLFLLITVADWLFLRLDIRFRAWQLWPLAILFVSLAFWAPIFLWWRERERLIGLAMPGSIFLVLGVLLLYQSVTGDWGSWAYAWSLIPVSVGLGLFSMYFLGGHSMRSNGLLWAAIVVSGVGLFFFVLFGSLFGGVALRIVAPILIILGGIALLVGAFVRRQVR